MVAQPVTVDRRSLRPVFAPRGAVKEAFTCRDNELVVDGPAGTGKTRGLLEKVHLCSLKYPGSRWLLLRKVLEDLKGSALVTFRDQVRPDWEGVDFFHGNREEPPSYRYPNGSEVLIGGLDKPKKVMSKEFDGIYVNEATELVEEEWENLTTRLRHYVMPYQQLLGDCNPDAPTHWLRRREATGKLRMIPSRHEDNPMLWGDRAGDWTAVGREYMARLEALTGHRYQRLRLGKWVAAEGLVYPGFRPEQIMHVDCDGWGTVMGLDLGTRNPTCILTVRYAGDRIHFASEFYRTGLGSEEIENEAEARYRDAKAEWIVVDPSAAGLIVTLEKRGLTVRKAVNDVLVGISRMTSALPDITVDPSCRNMLAEFESYAYPTGQKTERDVPVKANDHAMDTARYLIMELVEPESSWSAVDPSVIASFLRT